MRCRNTIFGMTLLAAAALGGCAEDVPEIFIVNNQVLADDCELGTGGSQQFRARGTLDLLIGDSYSIFPLVRNDLVPSESAGFGGGGGGGLSGTDWEANTVTLRRAVVEINVPEALNLLIPREIEVELSGSMQPGDEASVELRAIPRALGQLLASSTFLRQSSNGTTISLRVKVFGVTSSGREVDSNEFIYPIELCFGCLLEVPPAAIDPTFPTPNCRITTFEGEDTTTDTNTICRVGQDDNIDCRLVCPLLSETLDSDPTGICLPE